MSALIITSVAGPGAVAVRSNDKDYAGSTMDAVPVALTKHEGGRAVDIQWSDGVEQRLPARLLRDKCPCATCREKKAAAAKQSQTGIRSLNILSPAELQPLQVTGMTPAGSYAYNIAFSDGHGSGVYTLEYLRELTGPSAPPSPEENSGNSATKDQSRGTIAS